jgi:hypothetical protein
MATNDVVGAFDHWSMVLVYDPKTGIIVHSHQAVTTRGGTHPDSATLQKQAADHAWRARNIAVDDMAFLTVDPRDIDFKALYTVDLKSRTLTKAPTTAARA